MTSSLEKLPKVPDFSANVDKHSIDVAPLNVSELLESLVRQSQPLMDHLGIKKGTRPSSL